MEQQNIISETDGLSQYINRLEQLQFLPSSSFLSTSSIYTVPATLRQLKPSAYTPRFVSIGLLHSKDERFKHANEYKENYMLALFHRTVKSKESRTKDVKDTISQCAEAMSALAPNVRSCYQGLQSSVFDDESIAQTMLVDGCFILELLMKFLRGGSIKKEEELIDPVVDKIWVLHDVVHDLFLLENQIPLFILDKLFEVTVRRIQPLTLTDLILRTCDMISDEFGFKIKDGTNKQADHLLGLLHSCYQPGNWNPYQPGNWNPRDYSFRKYTATDLDRSGVNFRPSNGDDDDSINLRVHFEKQCLFPWLAKLPPTSDPNKKSRCCFFSCLRQRCCGATLEIPKLCITDLTEQFLRNLIAFEQYSPNTPRYFTSYAFLMDTLIDSKEDVEVLETAEVMTNLLGTSKDASNLFNNLCKEVFLDRFYYSSEWQLVANYRQLKWPRRIASLRRNYFSSPWMGISVVAALILFVFTGPYESSVIYRM